MMFGIGVGDRFPPDKLQEPANYPAVYAEPDLCSTAIIAETRLDRELFF